MEGMSNMIKVVRTNKCLKGFEVAKNSNANMEVTHLHYVDDNLNCL